MVWKAVLFATAALLQTQTQELMNALVARDAKVWDRYLADDAVITTEDGDVRTKGELLKTLRPQRPKDVVDALSVTDFNVHEHGNVAVTTYVADERQSFHGQALHGSYRLTDTWLRTRGGWRLIGSQILAKRADPPAIEIPTEEYVGRYALTPEITYEIRRNGDGLEGRRGEGKWEPLKAEAPDVLFVPGKPRFRKVFQRDPARKIVAFADRREAWDVIWKRLP